jgi:hypothetical protein
MFSQGHEPSDDDDEEHGGLNQAKGDLNEADETECPTSGADISGEQDVFGEYKGVTGCPHRRER